MASSAPPSKRRRKNQSSNDGDTAKVETSQSLIPPEKFAPLVVFAHGAGAPSSSDWMIRWKEMLKKALGAVEVVTFDYPYISGGKRKAPPKAEKLVEFHLNIVKETVDKYRGHPLILVGKSMGSRVSCMVAAEQVIDVSAVVCLGYPLKGINGAVRDEILLQLTASVMFVQGSKDGLCPLDKLEAVRKKIKSHNELHVVDGGDHSFKIGKKHLQMKGSTQDEAERLAVEAITKFLSTCLGERVRKMGRHGKQLMGNTEPEKTKWTENLTDAFVAVYVEFIQSIPRTSGSPLPKIDWAVIAFKFQSQTGTAYSVQALKNKWDQLRKEWALWERMTQGETRLGWDSENRRVEMSDEWWDLKIQESIEFKKFKKNGYRYHDQLLPVFKGSLATEERCIASASGCNPVQIPTAKPPAKTDGFGDDGDFYRPIPVNLQSLGIDPEPEKSTATSPTKRAETTHNSVEEATPVSRKAATTPISGDFGSPFIPSSSAKPPTASKKRSPARVVIPQSH